MKKIALKAYKVILLILLVLFADQALKIWVKLNMVLNQDIMIFDWFRIHFVENEGMAFGITLGGVLGNYAKIALSLFRILAVGFITYFLAGLIQRKASAGLIFSVALILAGALGNILDSTFYGLLFSESRSYLLATFLPEAGGYAGLLHGKVVDMFYFPLYEGHLPNWIPFWGGDHVLFFRPVFNIADAAITVGVATIILFQRSFFATLEEKQTTPSTPSAPTEEVTQNLVHSN